MKRDTTPAVPVLSRAAVLAAGLAIIGCALCPMAAQAFIDERSPPPAPAVLTPPAPPQAPPAPAWTAPTPLPAAPAPLPATTPPVQMPPPVPLAAGAPTSVALEPGVRGDLGKPGWKLAYPGPYGEMDLSEALIADIVPVAGGAIQLNGDPQLLSRKVVMTKGANRLQTLKSVAKSEGLSIMVQGDVVSLAGGHAPTTLLTARGAVQSLPSPLPLAGAGPQKITKTWNIDTGTMLSTAMLNWANQWGWHLIWKADVDYRIKAPITLNDDFLGAVGQVLDAYKGGDRPLWGDWNGDQKVLVVCEPSERKKCN